MGIWKRFEKRKKKKKRENTILVNDDEYWIFGFFGFLDHRIREPISGYTDKSKSCPAKSLSQWRIFNSFSLNSHGGISFPIYTE